MSPNRLVLSAWVVLALMASRSEAGPVVELRGWASEGTLIRGMGQGPDLIRLVAEADWDSSASRDPGPIRSGSGCPTARSNPGISR